jgi:2'-5' RNA ligase
MRAFIAIVPPDEVVEHLDEFLSPRRDFGEFRWSAPEQLHLTLAFMADLPAGKEDDLLERLATAAGRRTPFELAITGAGAFPHPAAAKVLWAGVDAGEAGDELDALARGARNAAAAAGARPDGGAFRPHLTLARVRFGQEVTRWIRLLDSYRGPTWTVDSLQLIASHLGQVPNRRPRYEQIADIGLG